MVRSRWIARSLGTAGRRLRTPWRREPDAPELPEIGRDGHGEERSPMIGDEQAAIEPELDLDPPPG
jgi:hypothetical protein